MKKVCTFLTGTVMACSFSVSVINPVSAEPVLQGQVCSERVHELTSSITWHKNLHQAEEIAKEQGKLIFWVHMVGKIDGAT